MKKIQTLFERNPENMKYVLPTVRECCAWVTAGEGIATVKFDGTCCLIQSGTLYRRHALKEGKSRPPGWFHWSKDPDQKSGHGWVPVNDSPNDWQHREVIDLAYKLTDGTYELVGPKIQRNPHHLEQYTLKKHGSVEIDFPVTYDEIKTALATLFEEGVVWHHPDGRMAKIKRTDFGHVWPLKRGAP